jgi:acetolactate synthase small subunit
MKRFSEQFNTKAKSIKLSAIEKRELRERVISYMEYHPLPHGVTAQVVSSDIKIPSFILSPKIWHRFQLVGSFVLVCAISISYLAERAVPGDTLYAIKVDVNEEVRSSMTLGSYEKVVWETERLNRRIAEARLLASEGRLTEEVESQVATAVKEHTDNARKEIENLQLTDKDEATLAAIELTTALDVQTTSLRNQGEAELEGQSSTDQIEESVLVASQAVELVTEQDTLPAYDRLMAKVESESTRAHELLKGVADSATLEEQNDISRRLEDIERKVAVAMGLVQTDEIVARQDLIAVLEQTHRLIVFMTNIDVRESMTVDEIVPVTLTEGERIDQVKKQITEAQNILIEIETVLTATASEPVAEEILSKVIPAVEQGRAAALKASEILVAEPVDIGTAEGVSLEAYNILVDAARLLNILPAEVIQTEVLPETPIIEPVTEEVSEEPAPVDEATTTEAVTTVEFTEEGN